MVHRLIRKIVTLDMYQWTMVVTVAVGIFVMIAVIYVGNKNPDYLLESMKHICFLACKR